MKTPIATLVKRHKYKGGRKFRSAFRKLGKYRLSELHAAGFTVTFVYPKKNSDEQVIAEEMKDV